MYKVNLVNLVNPRKLPTPRVQYWVAWAENSEGGIYHEYLPM